MSTDRGGPPSAVELAALLGEALPPAASVRDPQTDLVAAVRRLVDATVATAADDEACAEVAGAVRALAERLEAEVLDLPRLVRHPGGRLENLSQAGSGRLNPRAAPIEFAPYDPPPGGAVTPVEVTATCVLGASAGGSPGRAHGGVVAALLDEVLGVAVTAAGASGLTVALDVRFRAAVPLGAPLDLRARCTTAAGRTSTATGELLVGGAVAAEATAVFVRSRPGRIDRDPPVS